MHPHLRAVHTPPLSASHCTEHLPLWPSLGRPVSHLRLLLALKSLSSPHSKLKPGRDRGLQTQAENHCSSHPHSPPSLHAHQADHYPSPVRASVSAALPRCPCRAGPVFSICFSAPHAPTASFRGPVCCGASSVSATLPHTPSTSSAAPFSNASFHVSLSHCTKNSEGRLLRQAAGLFKTKSGNNRRPNW